MRHGSEFEILDGFGLVGSTKNYNLAGNEQLLRVHFFHAFVGKKFFTNLVAFALKVRKF